MTLAVQCSISTRSTSLSVVVPDTVPGTIPDGTDDSGPVQNPKWPQTQRTTFDREALALAAVCSTDGGADGFAFVTRDTPSGQALEAPFSVKRFSEGS